MRRDTICFQKLNALKHSNREYIKDEKLHWYIGIYLFDKSDHNTLLNPIQSKK